MEKKPSLGSILAGAGKAAKETLEKSKEKTAKIIDTGKNMKIDLPDVGAAASTAASTVGGIIKKQTQNLKSTAEDTARNLERKALQPVFPADLEDVHNLPKTVRIVVRDKKHSESAQCQGSVGYGDTQKGLQLLNLFYDSLRVLDLTFAPDENREFYLADPADKKHYIGAGEYFAYLRNARIEELKQIACALGASGCEIKTFERQTEQDGENVSAIQIGDTIKESFPGGKTKKPDVRYLSEYPGIYTLVKVRMDGLSTGKVETGRLELGRSVGISVEDAAKLDSVIRAAKAEETSNLAEETEKENLRYIEYRIIF